MSFFLAVVCLFVFIFFLREHEAQALKGGGGYGGGAVGGVVVGPGSIFVLAVLCWRVDGLWECHNARWSCGWGWDSRPCTCVSVLHVVGVAGTLEGSDLMFDCVDE